MVIGATGLLTMGAVVAGGALIKGFKEGAKTVKDALNDLDDDAKAKNEKAESSDASDSTEAETTEASSKEEI